MKKKHRKSRERVDKLGEIVLTGRASMLILFVYKRFICVYTQKTAQMREAFLCNVSAPALHYATLPCIALRRTATTASAARGAPVGWPVEQQR